MATSADAPRPKVLTVRCPACSGPSRYMPDNPWRPFCSERCKSIDLGAWASESYRVPDGAPSDDQDDLPPPG